MRGSIDFSIILKNKTAQQVDAPETYAPDKNIVVLPPYGRSAATIFLSSAPVPVILDVGLAKIIETIQEKSRFE